jgi:hypothetical protein
VLSGNARRTGEYTFVARASDEKGRTDGRELSMEVVTRPRNGLQCEIYNQALTDPDDYKDLSREKLEFADNFTLEKRQQDTRFALRFLGYIRVPEEGTYEFMVRADDGHRLTIGDQIVSRRDQVGQMRGEDYPLRDTGEIVLKPGFHPLELVYWQVDNQMHLEVEWTLPGSSRRNRIPDENLFYELPPELQDSE